MAEQSIPEAAVHCLESISVSGYSRQHLASLVVLISERADAASPFRPVASASSSQGEHHRAPWIVVTVRDCSSGF